MPGPIATVGSNQLCPMCNGPTPHVGGPVVQGSPNVFVAGQPVATVGSACTCVGPPSTIIQGEARVFVNGMPVATVGSATSHGGVVVNGNPTVIIGARSPGPPSILPPDRIEHAQREEIKKHGFLATFSFSV